MESAMNSAAAPTLAPLPGNQRIEALDVVRGFALIGIFLMNIEFFSRAMSGIGEGMPLGLTGLDWFASWFVAYFVQGKFWTIFSLLFGMGFAVMLTRAERAGRDFIGIYLRRILALAVFGAVHYIYIWQGDILFSYAVAAVALLILLYGKLKPILIAMVLLIAAGFIPVPGFSNLYGVAGGLAFVGLLALFLRSERHVTLRGISLPLFSVILLSLGLIGIVAAAVFWLLPNGPTEPRIPLSIMGPAFLIVGWLSAKYHQPAEKRGVRMAVTLYVFSAMVATLFGAVDYLVPEPVIPADKTAKVVAVQPVPANPLKVEQSVAAKSDVPVAEKTPAAKVAEKTPAAKVAEKTPALKVAEKTPAEKAAEKKAERAKRLELRQEETQNEVRIMSQGSYAETVLLRAREFLDKAAGDASSATVLIAMFLLGTWFVRSGVMENTAAHLKFFRKLAWIALPLGIGLGLLGSLIAVTHIPGEQHDGFMFASGLKMLGNLPACVGYVGLVVLMLHSKTAFSKINVLAPVGRMALTNYLTQSLIGTFYFYGYGLGHWGMGRAAQVAFVVIVFALQVIFSHWWLARFRYGPMEWVWRAFTYGKTPTMRIDSAAVTAGRAAV